MIVRTYKRFIKCFLCVFTCVVERILFRLYIIYFTAETLLVIYYCCVPPMITRVPGELQYASSCQFVVFIQNLHKFDHGASSCGFDCVDSTNDERPIITRRQTNVLDANVS